jgi:hypothetical protein
MQLAFQQSGAEFNPIGDDVVRRASGKATTRVSGSAKLEWLALLRKLDRIDPSYKE